MSESNNKVNGKLDFRNVKQSQLNSGQTLKGSFSELQSSLRTYATTPVLKDAYTHFTQTVNANGKPTYVEYFQATSPSIQEIVTRADVSGDLAGKYITLEEYLSKRIVVLYYKVNGSGSAPGIGDIEIPIDIQINDPASIVAIATKNAINNELEYFKVNNLLSWTSNKIELSFLQFGESDPISVGTSGFTTNILTQGSSFKVGDIFLDYNVNGDPIYNGSTLKGLLFNVYTASFDVERDTVTAIVDLEKPSSFVVNNYYFATKDSPQNIIIPNGTKKFKLKSREANTQIRIIDTISGDYFTIPYGETYIDDELKTDSVTLKIETSRDDRTIELLLWS